MEKLIIITWDNDYSMLSFQDKYNWFTLSKLKQEWKYNGTNKIELLCEDDVIYVEIIDVVVTDDIKTALYALEDLGIIDYDQSKHNSFLFIEE